MPAVSNGTNYQQFYANQTPLLVQMTAEFDFICMAADRQAEIKVV